MSTQLLVFLLAGVITTFTNSAVAATVDNVDVSIEVSYTPPDDFTREAPYYRAASALTLTCVVAEGNGVLFYQWTSTCQGFCFLQGGATQSVSTHALHSRDSGVHTCTVYDGLGCTGNASITVHVAGAGIYVTHEHEVLSNNGIITAQSTGHISEFRCISATLRHNVGNLMGPLGVIVTFSTSDPFLVTRSRAYDPGILRVRSHGVIEVEDEGVYTCRIPNEFNTMVDINVGIYGHQYNGTPEMTSMSHNLDQLPYTITCISTGSPPTSVMWEKDGVILVEDAINKFSQILVDRRTSTYQNVLTIDESFAATVADYTCTVNNSFGESNTLEISIQALEVTGYERPFRVGLTGELICSTHLDIGELEWYLVGTEEPLVESSNRTLTLVVDVQSTALDGNQFTCRATTVDGGIHEETVTIEVKELEHMVTIAAPTNPILAGERLQLTCVVTTDFAPQVSWVDPNSNELGETGDVYISMHVVDGNTTTLVLSFTTLKTSHGGEYSCVSNVSDPAASIKTSTRDVIVKIPQPTVSLARKPTDDVIYTTSALELSCAVLVDETVDTAVTITSSWTGHYGTVVSDSHITIFDASVSNLEHYSRVNFTSVLSSDSGNYTCTVNVEPSLSSLFVESSTVFSSSTTLQAVLRVEIEVIYTAPDQYPDYHPPEYRAASAVSLRCVAYGTSVNASYRWSSTCVGCFASSSFYQTITNTFLRSYDAGVHTCTVTDYLTSGSNSTEMKIVSAGIYVSYNYWHTGIRRRQAVANNSMLWVNTAYAYYGGKRLELWCCSNSSEFNIGLFVFPPGYTYYDDTGYYDIDRQSGGSYAGCIYFEIYDSYAYSSSLSYSGIYTCQIPDALGNSVDVGFGLYPRQYSYPPSISGLYHEASTTIFTLSCHTTSYPATMVTWTRDGIPINIDQETTKVQSILTNAPSAYYETIFMSSEDPDDLVGTYTCTAGNQFGSDTSGQLEVAGIEIVHTGTQSLIVSGSGTFTCSSDLDILQIEWFADGSLVAVTSSNSSQVTLDPVSTDHQVSVYSCIAISPYGTQERSITLSVTVPDNWASVEIVNSTGENPINNTHYTLTCTVNGIEGMNLPVVIEWMAPNGSVITSSERITVGDEATNGTTTSLTLTFDPVYNRDAGLYTCRAGVDVPWMSQQPPIHSATVDITVTTQAIIQLKMGPIPNCLNWEMDRAISLGDSIMAAIQGAVRERCSCNYLSSLSIYNAGFICQSTLTSMVYRARINGTSLLTANQILSYIEDWRDSEGTFLHEVFYVRLVQKDACPLHISSFHDLDCDTGDW